MTMRRVGLAAILAGLTGCVAAPPPVYSPPPLVAVPGPAKTQAQFTQDDGACRAEAGQAAQTSQPQPAPGQVQGVAPGQSQAQQPTSPSSGYASSGQVANAPAGAQQAAGQAPPGLVYLRCMSARNNLVEPLPTAAPPAYAYYVPDPLYPYGDYAPFLYSGYGFGFFGGCCYGGFREGYYRGGGFGGFGGYRGGGFGDFRDGGFGGGRGGGGFHGGGFGGGGRFGGR